MSPRSSDPSPSADVYVGLVVVSCAALIGGIVFLVFELQKYAWQLGPGP